MRLRRVPAALPAHVALGLLTLFVCVHLARGVTTGVERVRSAVRHHRNETAWEALGRHRDAGGYMEGILRIRETVPPDAAYFLCDVDRDHTDYVVRFDLAPRKPVLLERPEQLETERLRFGPRDAPRYLVEARASGAPRLVALLPLDGPAPSSAPSTGSESE